MIRIIIYLDPVPPPPAAFGFPEALCHLLAEIIVAHFIRQQFPVRPHLRRTDVNRTEFQPALHMVAGSIIQRHHIRPVRIEHTRLRIVMIAYPNDIPFPDSGTFPYLIDLSLHMVHDAVLQRCHFQYKVKPQAAADLILAAVYIIIRQIRSISNPLFRTGQIAGPFKIQYLHRMIRTIDLTGIHRVIPPLRIPLFYLFHRNCLLFHQSDGHKGILIRFCLFLVDDPESPADTEKSRGEKKQNQKQNRPSLHPQKLPDTVFDNHPVNLLSLFFTYRGGRLRCTRRCLSAPV